MKVLYAFAASVALTLFQALPAQAQQAPCHPISPTDRVVVTTQEGGKLRGTVICLADQSLVLLRDGVTTETPLSQIRRIDTRPDPVWDGALKGAIVPLVLWAVFCNDCDSELWLKNIAAYSMIGVAWDAAQRNTRTIYAGRPVASVGWRLRF